MNEWISLLLTAFGILFLGAGGGAWLMSRKHRRTKVLPPTPDSHDSVAPTPEEVSEADQAAEDTSSKLRELEDAKEDLDNNPPPRNHPTEEGVEFLDSLQEDKED
jgi:hypothetical protein